MTTKCNWWFFLNPLHGDTFICSLFSVGYLRSSGDGDSEVEEEEENEEEGAEEEDTELFKDNYVVVGKIFENII